MGEDCIFCKIGKGELKTEFVFEDDDVIAFKDIHPQAPVHLLIVPKRHIPTINALADEDSALLGKMILVARDLAREFGVNESGYRLIFNVEKGGGQLIFHIHLHLVGGWKEKDDTE